MKVVIDGVEYVPKKRTRREIPIPCDICVRCGAEENSVLDSRPMPNCTRWRKRRCSKCGKTWTTLECGYTFDGGEQT